MRKLCAKTSEGALATERGRRTLSLGDLVGDFKCNCSYFGSKHPKFLLMSGFLVQYPIFRTNVEHISIAVFRL